MLFLGFILLCVVGKAFTFIAPGQLKDPSNLTGIQIELDDSNFTPCKDFEIISSNLEEEDALPQSEQLEDFQDEECSERGIWEFFPKELNRFISIINRRKPNFETPLESMAQEGCLQSVIAQRRDRDSALGLIRSSKNKDSHCTGAILSSQVIITLKECYEEGGDYEFQPRIFLKEKDSWFKAKVIPEDSPEDTFMLLVLESKLEKIERMEYLFKYGGGTECNFFVQGYLPSRSEYVKTNCPDFNNIGDSGMVPFNDCQMQFCPLEDLQPGSPVILSCQENDRINHFYWIGMIQSGKSDNEKDLAIFIDDTMGKKIKKKVQEYK